MINIIYIESFEVSGKNDLKINITFNPISLLLAFFQKYLQVPFMKALAAHL